MNRNHIIRSVGFVVALASASCGSSNQSSPARTTGNCVKKAAKTGVAGAKTGVVTGIEGVKQVGKTVGGFVEGGSAQADREWQAGKADTKRAAHTGADEVKEEANAPDCP